MRRAPSRLCFPIGPHHVKSLLSLQGLTPAQQRDVLMSTTGTLLSCRVVEVAMLQVCDFLWDMDGAYHEIYIGTAAVRIYRRKQDTSGTGHYPRLGTTETAEWDIVQRLRRYATRHGLGVSEQCTKRKNAGARCRHCAPFFFSEKRKGQAIEWHELSRQQVTGGVLKSLKLTGVDTTHYSGQSMHVGGLSASFMRQDHQGGDAAAGHGGWAEGYMRPCDPKVWYESFGAFKL